MAWACLSLACWLLLHRPPSYQTGRRGAGWSLGEGASLWSLPAQWEGNCEGNLSPALTGRNNPSTSGKLAVSLSAWAGCALASPAPTCAGRGFLCHPPAPCPRNTLRPTSQRAPAVAGTGHTDRILTPRAIADPRAGASSLQSTWALALEAHDGHVAKLGPTHVQQGWEHQAVWCWPPEEVTLCLAPVLVSVPPRGQPCPYLPEDAVRLSECP